MHVDAHRTHNRGKVRTYFPSLPWAHIPNPIRHTRANCIHGQVEEIACVVCLHQVDRLILLMTQARACPFQMRKNNSMQRSLIGRVEVRFVQPVQAGFAIDARNGIKNEIGSIKIRPFESRPSVGVAINGPAREKAIPLFRFHRQHARRKIKILRARKLPGPGISKTHARRWICEQHQIARWMNSLRRDRSCCR